MSILAGFSFVKEGAWLELSLVTGLSLALNEWDYYPGVRVPSDLSLSGVKLFERDTNSD